ncbi:MAG: methyltransferase domain-containing protein [Candidatus Woesearchaeota archaeon]
MNKKWKGKNFDPEKILNPKIWSEMFLLYSSLSREIKNIAPSCKGKLLDVGAGPAPYKKIFTKYVKEYITLDFFESPNCKVDIISSAYSIPFPDNSFDVVLCTQVLEHLEYPQQAINEMRRVLKPNGILILTTHMAMVLHSEPYDYFRYTKYGLAFLLKEFKKVKIKEIGGAIYFMCQIFSWAFFYKLFKPLSYLFIIFFNILGIVLDKLLYSDLITINYFVVAKK